MASRINSYSIQKRETDKGDRTLYHSCFEIPTSQRS